MATMTITEALAEIKTINARIVKKREAVMRYFARDGRLRDPLESDGGSVEFVRRERQAIADLEVRIVTIRTAIQRANLTTTLTVEGVTKTVQEWLNWRREVFAGAKGFLSTLVGQLNALRTTATKAGQTLSDKDSGNPGEIVVAAREQDLAREVENLETVQGALDGKLSLVNATTSVSF